MITKAIIKSIDRNKNKCSVRMPLFETASSPGHFVVDALISIPPGVYNNLFVDDIVFVSFEENALEKPIVIGKLYRGPKYESDTKGGAGIFNSVLVRDTTTVQAATTFFKFNEQDTKTLTSKNKNNYKQLYTAKQMAYYILDTENDIRSLLSELREDFTCFTRWVSWKVSPENVHVDDGDLGDKDYKQKYEIDKDKDAKKHTNRCEICEGKNSCLARYKNIRPTSHFPEKPSNEFPPYPSYLTR